METVADHMLYLVELAETVYESSGSVHDSLEPIELVLWSTGQQTYSSRSLRRQSYWLLLLRLLILTGWTVKTWIFNAWENSKRMVLLEIWTCVGQSHRTETWRTNLPSSGVDTGYIAIIRLWLSPKTGLSSAVCRVVCYPTCLVHILKKIPVARNVLFCAHSIAWNRLQRLLQLEAYMVRYRSCKNADKSFYWK